MQRVTGWVAAGALLLMGVGLAQADGAPVRAEGGTSPVAPATSTPRAALACVRRGATWVPHAVIMRRVMIGGRPRMVQISTPYAREAALRLRQARAARGARRVALRRQARILAERAERMAVHCAERAGADVTRSATDEGWGDIIGLDDDLFRGGGACPVGWTPVNDGCEVPGGFGDDSPDGQEPDGHEPDGQEPDEEYPDGQEPDEEYPDEGYPDERDDADSLP